MGKLLITTTLTLTLLSWNFALGQKMARNGRSDCIKCGNNLEGSPDYELEQDQSITVLRNIYENSFGACFNSYNSTLDSPGPKTNYITDDNAFYVCGCISNMMAENNIDPANSKESRMAQQAIANIAIEKKIADLRSMPARMQHDFSQIVGADQVSCDIEAYIKTKSSSCKHSQTIFTAAAVKSLESTQIDFSNIPAITNDDYLGLIIFDLAKISENNAGQDTVTETTRAISQAEAVERFQNLNMVRGNPFLQRNTSELITADLNLSRGRAQRAGNTSRFAATIHSAENFRNFYDKNYMQYTNGDGEYWNRMKSFYEEARARSVSENQIELQKILPQAIPALIKDRCNGLKEEFDNICQADSSIASMSQIPHAVNYAYEKINQVYEEDGNIPSGAVYSPLHSLAKLRGTKVTPQPSDITHMVICQDKSQSLQDLYSSCPAGQKSYDQMSDEELNSCLSIDELGSKQCDSYEALFKQNLEFQEMIINANIGITASSSNLESILYSPGETQELPNDEGVLEKVCLRGGSENQNQSQFRLLLNQHLQSHFFNHTYAKDVAPTQTLSTGGNNQRSNSSNSDSSKDFITFDYSGENSRQESLVILPDRSKMPPEVAQIIPEDIAQAAAAVQPEMMGPYNPANYYANQATTEKNLTDTSLGTSTVTNKNDAQIAALMKEIDELNRKLLENTDETEEVDQRLAQTGLTADQKQILEVQRAELKEERRQLEEERTRTQREHAKKIAETKAAQAIANSRQSHKNSNIAPQATPEKATSESTSSGSKDSSAAATALATGPSIGSNNSSENLTLSEAFQGIGANQNPTIIDDPSVARNFLENGGTIANRQPLELIYPDDENKIIRCIIKADAPAKDEYVKADFDCTDPILKSEFRSKRQQAKKPKVITPKKETVKEIDPVTFEDAKKVIGTE